MVAYLQQQQSSALEARIDQDQYDEAQLISIKVSLNLPYYNGYTEFERTYGSIKIEGVDYEYVKRRVYKDTLELLCLPNYQKTKLSTVSGEIAKGIADNGAQPTKKPLTIKTLLPDFLVQQTEQPLTPGLTIAQIQHLNLSDALPSNYSSSKDKPPQVLS